MIIKAKRPLIMLGAGRQPSALADGCFSSFV